MNPSYEEIGKIEMRLKKSPEAGQALHLAMKAFAALELRREGYDVELERTVEKMRIDVIGKKGETICIVECCTHKRDVEKAIKKAEKISQLKPDTKKILVTTQDTLRKFSFDFLGKDPKSYFNEIWIAAISSTLACSDRTETYPMSLAMNFTSYPFKRESP